MESCVILMQVNLQRKTIDQQLNTSLHIAGAGGSVFQWYLALQIDDITQYHAEKETESEDSFPYPSINLPSAPKPSLYAQDKHYQHQNSLVLCKKPALNIHLMNCMHPNSLHWLKHEQPILNEIIENSPLHTQQAHAMQKREAETAEINTIGVSDTFQSNTKNEVSVNMPSNMNRMPTNTFVDTTLENTASALNIVL